jgi:hypothetical protein
VELAAGPPSEPPIHHRAEEHIEHDEQDQPLPGPVSISGRNTANSANIHGRNSTCVKASRSAARAFRAMTLCHNAVQPTA